MKFIVAKSSYPSVKEVLIPIDEISSIELKNDNEAVVYVKHKDEVFFIDYETYCILKFN